MYFCLFFLYAFFSRLRLNYLFHVCPLFALSLSLVYLLSLLHFISSYNAFIIPFNFLLSLHTLIHSFVGSLPFLFHSFTSFTYFPSRSLFFNTVSQLLPPFWSHHNFFSAVLFVSCFLLTFLCYLLSSISLSHLGLFLFFIHFFLDSLFVLTWLYFVIFFLLKLVFLSILFIHLLSHLPSFFLFFSMSISPEGLTSTHSLFHLPSTWKLFSPFSSHISFFYTFSSLDNVSFSCCHLVSVSFYFPPTLSLFYLLLPLLKLLSISPLTVLQRKGGVMNIFRVTPLL